MLRSPLHTGGLPLPKGTDLSGYSQEQLDAVTDEINTRPRKGLGVRSPLVVYQELLMNNPQHSTLVLKNRVLHFRFESAVSGHRCGKSVVRTRWARVWMLSLPGRWQTNHRPIIQTISALLGDLDNSGGTAAGVGLCLWGTFATHCGDGGANFGESRLTTVLFMVQF